MNILDIPLWQLMGSKETQSSTGIYISKPKIADYAWCKLEGFEIVFKDINITCINTDNGTNSFTALHDPIIQVRKKPRGISSIYIEDDWEGIKGFYDEDYGDLFNITNGEGSITFNVGGQYVRTPKNILSNVVKSDFDKCMPMRLGDLLFPLIGGNWEMYTDTNVTDRIQYSGINGKHRNKGGWKRMMYDLDNGDTDIMFQIGVSSSQTAGNGNTYKTNWDPTNKANVISGRVGQWPSDVIDYELEMRIRNLPQTTGLKVVWTVNYSIELKAKWSCRIFEPVIYKDDALLLKAEVLRSLRMDVKWAWLNKATKIIANAFIDWLIPTRNARDHVVIKPPTEEEEKEILKDYDD